MPIQCGKFLQLYIPMKLKFLLSLSIILSGLPHGSDGKESACNEGDLDSVPGLGGSPGEGNGNPV